MIIKNTKNSYEFYENLLSGKMGKLDIFNTIDEITGSNLDKIKALKDDLEMYLGKGIYYPFLESPPINLKEKREETVFGIKWRNKEICKIKLPKSIGKNGGVITPAAEFFNLEETSSPDNYFSVCKVINVLKGKINLAKNRNSEKMLSTQPTKTEILKDYISQYGFFKLKKVSQLPDLNKTKLIEKISENGLPYAIAMFDYLDFITYLEKEHFDTKDKRNREIAKWFNSDNEGRAVKGNISSLLSYTTENKKRYTAFKHEETVIKDYEQLK